MRAFNPRPVSGIVVVISAAALALTAWASSANFFRIATGTSAGTSFPIGRVIASAITNPPGSRACEDGGSCGVPGLIAVAHSTQGPLQNLQMIGRGMVESGFVEADLAAWAYQGEGVFQTTGRLDNLRVIASLYSESVQIVVAQGRDIRRVPDLAGKRISIGTRESGVAERGLAILEAFGVGVDDFIKEYHQPAQAADRLRDGRLDAMIVIDGFPVPVMVDLARDGLIDILPIDGAESAKLIKGQSHFRRHTIPAGAYRGLGARETVAVASLWLTSAAVDSGLVYQITKALWNEGNRALLDGGHPKGRQIRLESAVQDLVVPLHDGAKRYYREVGVIR